MDISAIKAKLEALNTDGRTKEKIDYTKIYWKPTQGKQQIRIVPSMFDPTFPFKELKFHYGIGKFPILALSNFGKQDPVEEFVKELRKTSDKDNWSLSGKLSPKTRIFAPVIVRGEEEMGVRLWGFGVTIYKSLLALAEDEDIGDYTDVINGWDMVVEQQPGNPYPETSVRIKPKQTPLSEDATNVKMWLENQPDPVAINTEYDYDFVKKKLLEHLNPEAIAAPEEAAPTAPAKTDFTLETAEKKDTAVVSKFDDLFN